VNEGFVKMADEIRRTPGAMTPRGCGKLTREEARLDKVNGQPKAAAILWIATQRDTQEARTQYLQWQTAEAKRQLMLTSNREHAAHWKVLHHMETQRQIEESIRTLRSQCPPHRSGWCKQRKQHEQPMISPHICLAKFCGKYVP